MHRRTIQPSKEQVRAWMQARGRALRPPPSPDDIRRQLGWQLAPTDEAGALAVFRLYPASLVALVSIGQCATRLLLGCCMAPLRPPPWMLLAWRCCGAERSAQAASGSGAASAG